MITGLATGHAGSEGSPEDRGLGATELVGAIKDSKEGGLGGIGEVRGLIKSLLYHHFPSYAALSHLYIFLFILSSRG
jgi:hypothetical protein